MLGVDLGEMLALRFITFGNRGDKSQTFIAPRVMGMLWWCACPPQRSIIIIHKIIVLYDVSQLSVFIR